MILVVGVVVVLMTDDDGDVLEMKTVNGLLLVTLVLGLADVLVSGLSSGAGVTMSSSPESLSRSPSLRSSADGKNI